MSNTHDVTFRNWNIPTVNLCMHCTHSLERGVLVHRQHGTRPCHLVRSFVIQNYIQYGFYHSNRLIRDYDPEYRHNLLARRGLPTEELIFDDCDAVLLDTASIVSDEEITPFWIIDRERANRDFLRWGPVEEATVSVVGLGLSPTTNGDKRIFVVEESFSTSSPIVPMDFGPEFRPLQVLMRDSLTPRLVRILLSNVPKSLGYGKMVFTAFFEWRNPQRFSHSRGIYRSNCYKTPTLDFVDIEWVQGTIPFEHVDLSGHEEATVSYDITSKVCESSYPLGELIISGCPNITNLPDFANEPVEQACVSITRAYGSNKYIVDSITRDEPSPPLDVRPLFEANTIPRRKSLFGKFLRARILTRSAFRGRSPSLH